MSSPGRLNITSEGTTTVTASTLSRVIVNTGDANATIELSDADGVFATIAINSAQAGGSYDLVYDLALRGRTRWLRRESPT